jgi:hypothetical protein
LVEALDALDEPNRYTLKRLKESNGNPVCFVSKGVAHNLLLDSTTMKTRDSLKTTKLIRSQKTGNSLPRQGVFVRAIENVGRNLILVDFGSAGQEYLFSDEVLGESRNGEMVAG